MKKYFPHLILLSALLISFTGSFFSIYGLGKFYGGHWLGVTILAFAIELGNIIIASSLKWYWKYLSWWLKVPLIICSIVLVSITSWGIYNYLSDGFQKAYMKDQVVQKKTELIRIKKDNFQNRIDDNKRESISIVSNLQELSKGYNQNTQTQQLIKGQLITNVIVGNKKGLEQQMNLLNQRKNKLDSLNIIFQDSIQKLELQIIEVENNSDVTSELAPLKYLSDLLNQPMKVIVNILTLLIVIVTQPLALMLILTSMFAFKNNHYLYRGKKKESKKGKHIEVKNEDFEVVTEPEKPVEPKKTKRSRKRKPKVEIPETSSIIEESSETPIEISQEEEIPAEENNPKSKRKRKVIDNQLTPDIATHIAESLKRNKSSKLSNEQKRIMSQQQIDQWETTNKDE